MDFVSSAFSVAYQFGDAFAFLVLSAAGLAVIFGMMGVINLAHGEFIMCGAYVTVALTRTGLPLPLAIICGAIAAGRVGLVLERFLSPPCICTPAYGTRNSTWLRLGQSRVDMFERRFDPAGQIAGESRESLSLERPD